MQLDAFVQLDAYVHLDAFVQLGAFVQLDAYVQLDASVHKGISCTKAPGAFVQLMPLCSWMKLIYLEPSLSCLTVHVHGSIGMV